VEDLGDSVSLMVSSWVRGQIIANMEFVHTRNKDIFRYKIKRLLTPPFFFSFFLGLTIVVVFEINSLFHFILIILTYYF